MEEQVSSLCADWPDNTCPISSEHASSPPASAMARVWHLHLRHTGKRGENFSTSASVATSTAAVCSESAAHVVGRRGLWASSCTRLPRAAYYECRCRNT